MPIIPILFQTGYLTITDYDAQSKRYRLNYPNQEVGQSFKKYILEALTRIDVLLMTKQAEKIITPKNLF